MTTLYAPPQTASTIEYPDSDGQPMADNTEQWEWIDKLKDNFDILYADRDEVFVAANLLWYPVEGDRDTKAAPDVFVAFGRPKGYRGSYRQWEENDMPPQVVFEILSPGNRAGEMTNKFLFYDRFGTEEYYLYDPQRFDFFGWLRSTTDGRLLPIANMNGWVSPRLDVRFEWTEGRALVLRYPDGRPFLSAVQLAAERDAAQVERDAAQAERDAAQAERDTAQAERDAAQARAEKLAERLRALGLDPDAES